MLSCVSSSNIYFINLLLGVQSYTRDVFLIFQCVPQLLINCVHDCYFCILMDLQLMMWNMGHKIQYPDGTCDKLFDAWVNVYKL